MQIYYKNLSIYIQQNISSIINIFKSIMMFGPPIKLKQTAKKEAVQKKQQKEKIKWVNPLKDRTRVIPFVVPTHQERMAALGSLAGEKWRVKKSLEAILPFFQGIKKPQPGQNLFKNEEDGQDFPLFSSIYRNHIDLKQQVIYIATLKCNLPKQIISQIKKKAKAFFYGAKVKLHKFPENLDLSQFNQKISENGQKYYDAAKMNEYFTKHLPKNTFSIAIITSLLIYNGDRVQTQLEEQWIFGLGSIKDRTSITSYQQVLKKGYGNQKQKGSDLQEFNLQMLSKIVNHQICHTFAMKHCVFFTCLMNGSSGYEQASKKAQHICPVCIRKLHSELQFDFVERYEALGDQRSLQISESIKKNLGFK